MYTSFFTAAKLPWTRSMTPSLDDQIDG